MKPNDRRRRARIYRHPGAAAILGSPGDWLLQARDGWTPPVQQAPTLQGLEARLQLLHPSRTKTPNLLGLVVELVMAGDPEAPNWTASSIRRYRFQVDHQWRDRIRLRPRLPFRDPNLWIQVDDDRISDWLTADHAPPEAAEDPLRDLRPQDGPA